MNVYHYHYQTQYHYQYVDAQPHANCDFKYFI